MAHAMSAYRLSSFAGTVASTNAARVVRLGHHRGGSASGPGASDRIPAARMFEIWAELVHELSAPELPLETARQFRLEDLGLLGLVLLSAPSALGALESFVRFGPLLNDGRAMSLARDDHTVTLALHDPAPLALGVRLSHEATFAQITRGVAELLGRTVHPRRVVFRHEGRAGARALKDYFSCAVELGADGDRIVFDRAALERPRPEGNPAVYRYLAARANEELRALAPRPLVDRTRDAITLAIAEGRVPELEPMAASLGTSARSLRRALASAGTSFRLLVDGARRGRAEELLADGHLSLGRIAIDLAFSDASAFVHACHRWFGCAPRDLRPARIATPRSTLRK